MYYIKEKKNASYVSPPSMRKLALDVMAFGFETERSLFHFS